MALGSTMLQVDVLQQTDEIVTSIDPLFVQVFEFLSFGTTTVREIAAEKEGGIVMAASGSTLGFSSVPYAVLKPFLKGGEEVLLTGPSHVSSPRSRPAPPSWRSSTAARPRSTARR